ncbi:unnamed protein product [Camellia sinensis]
MQHLGENFKQTYIFDALITVINNSAPDRQKAEGGCKKVLTMLQPTRTKGSEWDLCKLVFYDFFFFVFLPDGKSSQELDQHVCSTIASTFYIKQVPQ